MKDVGPVPSIPSFPTWRSWRSPLSIPHWALLGDDLGPLPHFPHLYEDTQPSGRWNVTFRKVVGSAGSTLTPSWLGDTSHRKGCQEGLGGMPARTMWPPQDECLRASERERETGGILGPAYKNGSHLLLGNQGSVIKWSISGLPPNVSSTPRTLGTSL